MKISFQNKQELDTEGIIGIKQEEAQTVLVKYASHEVRLHGVTASEVMARVQLAKKSEVKPR